jgi:hypothetical protein
MSVSGSRSFPDTPRAAVTDIPVLHGVAAFAESQLAASTTTVRPHLLPAPPTAETRLSTFTLSSCGCLEHHIQPDRPRWESDSLREHFGVSDPKGRFDPGRNDPIPLLSTKVLVASTLHPNSFPTTTCPAQNLLAMDS